MRGEQRMQHEINNVKNQGNATYLFRQNNNPNSAKIMRQNMQHIRNSSNVRGVQKNNQNNNIP